MYVCSVCACLDLSVSSSSLGLGRAAVCACGISLDFSLTFCAKLTSVKQCYSNLFAYSSHLIYLGIKD